MDNTTINVSNVNMQVQIEAGGFRVYGNQPNALLNTSNFETENYLSVFPNPTNKGFYLSQNVSSIEIYNVTGQLIKTYHNQILANTEIGIEFLTNGVYFLKIKTEDGFVETKKLIKE